MALENVRGRRIQKGELAVVVGAGKSGLSATKLLRREGARVRLLDKNPEAISRDEAGLLRSEGIEILLGEHSPNHFSNAQLVVCSPGIPVTKILELIGASHMTARTQPEIISEIELAWRYLDNVPVLAITGTSGKTTTASLAAAMLQAQGYTVFLGGNIGTPLADYVLSGRKADVIVVEISSFQLQTCTTFCPRAAILLNITPNHLDHHASMEEYTEAKFRIFRCQDEEDLAILGEGLEEMAKKWHFRSRKLVVRDEDRFPETHLLGAHNRSNIEAAWQACRFFGVSQANAAKAVAAFVPLPHRLEFVRKLNGVVFVNDSKSTTVDSLRVALEAFNQPVMLLCGGKFKGGDLKALEPLVRSKVKNVSLFGASKEIFMAAWENVVPLCWHPTLEEAVNHLVPQASKGDVVLLSPATSSFDLYDSYVSRGEDFKRIVRKLS